MNEIARFEPRPRRQLPSLDRMMADHEEAGRRKREERAARMAPGPCGLPVGQWEAYFQMRARILPSADVRLRTELALDLGGQAVRVFAERHGRTASALIGRGEFADARGMDVAAYKLLVGVWQDEIHLFDSLQLSMGDGYLRLL